MNSTIDKLLVGRITTTWGIKGAIKLVSWCDPVENIFTYKQWWLSTHQNHSNFDESQCLTFNKGIVRKEGRMLIAELKGIESVNNAEPLLGKYIYIDKSDLNNRQNDFYWYELIGMKVFNTNNAYMGKVEKLITTGKNDVLKIVNDKTPQHSDSKKSPSYLIPFIKDKVIISINREEKIIFLDWSIDWYA